MKPESELGKIAATCIDTNQDPDAMLDWLLGIGCDDDDLLVVLKTLGSAVSLVRDGATRSEIIRAAPLLARRHYQQRVLAIAAEAN